MEMVKTVSGKNIPRKLCIKIAEDFYQKGVDVIQIDGRWFRKGNPKIYFNDFTKTYMKRSENTINSGIIGVEKNSYVLGSFEKSFENDFYLVTINGTYLVADYELFSKLSYMYLSSGYYCDKAYALNNEIDVFKQKPGNNYPYHFERQYNSSDGDLMSKFLNVDNKKYTHDLLTRFNKSNLDIQRLLRFSFGLEFETSAGVIPEYKCKMLGLLPLRDGSISGHEYTTIPLKPDGDGVNLLLNQIDELRTRCLIDKNCSTHLHFGGFPNTPEMYLGLFNLCYAIQEDIAKIFPDWAFDTSKFKGNGKDYCKKLPGKMSSVDNLYSFLSHSYYRSFDGDLTKPHPQDPERNRKWEIKERYYWVNFINAFFGDGSKTIEFRIHGPSLDPIRIINWIFICNAILRFAVENSEFVYSLKSSSDKISLNDIILSVYPSQIAGNLLTYITERSISVDESRANGDYFGFFDLVNDRKAKYTSAIG